MNCIVYNGYFTRDNSEPLVRLATLYCVLYSNIVESKCSVLFFLFIYINTYFQCVSKFSYISLLWMFGSVSITLCVLQTQNVLKGRRGNKNNDIERRTLFAKNVLVKDIKSVNKLWRLKRISNLKLNRRLSLENMFFLNDRKKPLLIFSVYSIRRAFVFTQQRGIYRFVCRL